MKKEERKIRMETYEEFREFLQSHLEEAVQATIENPGTGDFHIRDYLKLMLERVDIYLLSQTIKEELGHKYQSIMQFDELVKLMGEEE